MDTAAALEDMTQCPICLERFTQPKMLPCQHSYCLSCLISVVQINQSITCPTCREVHPLPSGGVHGLRDNLIIKNLLELKFESVQTTGNCSDCTKNLVLSTCEHCREQVCVDCRVSHNKMAWQVETALRNLKDLQTSQECRKEEWIESHGNMCEQIDKTSQTFRRLEEKLLSREQEVTKTMEFIERVHDIFTKHSSKPLLEDISHRLKEAKTSQMLSDLKVYTNSVQNAVDTMLSCGGSFVFSADGIEEIEGAIESLGSFKYGDSVVTMESLMSENAELKGKDGPPSASGSEAPLPEQGRTNLPEIPCLLPSRVNYANKAFSHVTVIDSSHAGSKLVNPAAAVFSPHTGKIYVADSDTDRIVAYDLKERSLKPAFLSFEPSSMAVIQGNLYITEAERRLRVADFETGNTHFFREHHFKADLVCSYGYCLIILDSESQGGTSIHIVDTVNEQIIRTFRIAATLVLGMAVGSNGDIFLSVQDRGHCSVQVYSIDGHFLKEFEADSGELGDISRLCVDADGFVCVSRPVSDRIDVYSRDGVFVCSFGTSGTALGQLTAPGGLSWMPDAKLLICDTDNNRVQIF